MNSHIVQPPSLSQATLAENRVVVLVPACNPGAGWPDFLEAMKRQTLPLQKVIILDSQSTDGAAETALSKGFAVQSVPRAQFNHGATRQLGIDMHATDADLVIFMTQDALPADPQSLQNLVRSFEDPQVAAAYGRQLPHLDAKPISAHARLFNYPAQGYTVTSQDIPEKGIKVCFFSNSFAAYRLSALREVGGFARHLIQGEDMQMAARLLLAGYALRYQADARVHHSHDYSIAEEMGRYFDTGVMHGQQKWLQEKFGSAAREGLRFLTSEVLYLGRHAPWLLPQAVLRTLIKYVGFKLGQHHTSLPNGLVKRLSMNQGFWS